MISVVVPVYKSEKTFVSCVESLLGQTCRDLEILLVDDGSPDNCPQLCDELARKDGRIRVIHKENGGVSSARNAGIEAAEGEYLFFCDSDDWVEPEMLEKLLLGMAGGDFALCGFHHHYLGADVVKTPDSADFLELYGRGFLNMPWNKLLRESWQGALMRA